MFVLTLLEWSVRYQWTVGVHSAVALLFSRLMLLGNPTEAAFTVCFVKRTLGFPILVFRHNSEACDLLSSLFPLSFSNPYITCRARILTREWSKRSYWHSTRVLVWSGLVLLPHLCIPSSRALYRIIEARGQARSHAIRDVLGIVAAVSRTFAGTKYRVTGV